MKIPNKKISEKIKELIEICKVEEEIYAPIILLALEGARVSGDDDMLANMVGKYVNDVLLPRLMEKDLNMNYNKSDNINNINLN